ncbi:glycosyltransferase [Rheinheimera sp.]|uniref:glycosyltransferase n=1 Tax=Rheinheimera sp. TaxID=1869214 RepID=UPI00307D9EED
MKIVHISTGLDIGGAEIMLERLLTRNPERKQDVVVISLQDEGPIGQRLRHQGYEVIALNMNGKLAFPIALLRLTKLLKKLKPHLVQTWMYHADLLGGVAAKLAGVKHIVWGIHCSNLPIGRPLTKLVMKACAHLSSILPDSIVAVADVARRNHIGYGYKADKFSVISNGFLPLIPATNSQIATIRRQLGVADNQTLIGAVGRYHPDKGQDILIEALALLPQELNWVCVLVGRDNDSANVELDALLKRHGVADKVRLLGLRDDVPVLLSCFDLFCLPSRSEAFPMALGEAMSIGLPCIATDVGDCRELIGDTGFIVPPLSPSLFAKAITELLMVEPEQRTVIGVRARERVLAFFSLDVVCTQYDQLYARLAGIKELGYVED